MSTHSSQSSSNESFVFVDKESMNSCSIINIAEENQPNDEPVILSTEDLSRSPSTSVSVPESGAAAIDPKVIEYFKLVRGISQEDDSISSAPASLVQLAAKVCEKMDTSASEQWAEWSAAFKSSLDSLQQQEQLQLPKSGSQSMPIDPASIDDINRHCQSLENGVGLDTGVVPVLESIDESQVTSDQETLAPLTSSCNSRTSTTDSEKTLGSYLRIVREENEQLKMVLEQNNESMKKQLRTVQTWQEEVASVRASYANLQSESESIVAKLKAENETLKEKLNAVGGVAHGEATGSFMWDSMTSEIGAMKSRLDRLPLLEQALNEKELQLDENQKKLSAARIEIRELNLQIAEQRIARIRDQESMATTKLQLELSGSEARRLADEKRSAEIEIKKLEEELSLILEENATLKEKAGLGAPTVNIGINSDSHGHHGRRHHRHLKRQARRLSENIVAGVGANLVLETFRQYRAT